jgi:3-hydroxyacyl-CoA dehydrogenase
VSNQRAAAIIGAGEIGSGWAVLFAAKGWTVAVHDTDADTPARIEAAARAAAACELAVPMNRILVRESIDEVLDGAEWVQESLPEDLPAKRRMLASIMRTLNDSAIVASSTSSFSAAELSAGLPYASRFVVAHPLQPVFAVPVVELHAAPGVPEGTLTRAISVMQSIGREPVVVRGTIGGGVSNRLTAALLREALVLLREGAVSVEELDRIVARGVASGWMAAGLFGTEAAGARGDPERAVQSLIRLLGAPRGETDDAQLLRNAIAQRSADVPGEEDWAELIARIIRAAERA